MAEHWPALVGAGIWVAYIVGVVIRFLDSRYLDHYAPLLAADAPLVSVIVPARNEARNIARCVGSILETTYPNVELIVVDDHSTDETAAIAARVIAEDSARHGGRVRARVVSAPDLPAGWFGKQWACHSGLQHAAGAILLFTDADTWHGPELLPRAVSALQARGSALFTVASRQEMLTFWEKVIQPYVFAVLLSRYGGMEAMSRSKRPVNKIANGQFMLFARAAYDAVGGHEAVREHVAEDLRLAQVLTARGLPVHMVLAPDHMATRMYQSLAEIRKGWGKNVFAAGRDTLPLNAVTARILPWIFPLPMLVPVIPLVVLALALAGVLGTGALWFGIIVSVANLLFWLAVYGFSRLNPLWGLTWPLASLVMTAVFAEAAWRGSRVEWKGRHYVSRS